MAATALEVLFICVRKVIRSVHCCGIRGDTRCRWRSSLDTQGFQCRINRKHFLMLRIEPLICHPTLSPFPRDLLDPFLTIISSFTFGSLQLLIELRRQVFSSISELTPRSHFLQWWRLRNCTFKLSCK